MIVLIFKLVSYYCHYITSVDKIPYNINSHYNNTLKFKSVVEVNF